MPNDTLCCVPECSQRGGHAWPSNAELSKKWLIAIRRDCWVLKRRAVVCRRHFTPSDYMYVTETRYGTIPQRRQLKTGVVPSVFPWSKEPSVSNTLREKRATTRIKRFELSNDVRVPEVGNEVEIETVSCISVDINPKSSTKDNVVTISASTQTPAGDVKAPMSIDRFINDDRAIHHFTGLETYAKFAFVLSTLGPDAYDLNYRWRRCPKLSIQNQFFITLIKLRQSRSNYDLSLMFNISEFSVSNIVITWINFTCMYYQWSELDIRATRDLVSYFMPLDFKKKFPSTRIILDGMEIPVKHPKCPSAQQNTFSSYKNRNTGKVVVGASPGGLVTHIPYAYGGSSSDRQLVERSGLMKMCDKGDSIMVDKGMAVQDLFAPYDVTINIPTFLKKGNQFSSRTLVNDRKVASKRVHIERIIGLAKTCKTLTQPLNATESILCSEIIFVCFMLCNFRTCIIPSNA